jgi:hypothetical protein
MPRRIGAALARIVRHEGVQGIPALKQERRK